MNRENDLLKPRWKVIADYPGSSYKIGDIVTNGAELYTGFPLIFKNLRWYEDRVAEEMPQYVKHIFTGADGEIKLYMYKISGWGIGEYITGFIEDGYSQITMQKDVYPATESEYLSYLKTKTP